MIELNFFILHSAFFILHLSLSDPIHPHNFTIFTDFPADINCIMDVTTISGASAFQQQTIANNVQTSVEAKVLDTQRTQGAAVLQLLQASTVSQSSRNSKGLDVSA